jgi:hypothetical protein
MKRILFLLLFCFFCCGILFAESGQGPEKIVVHPLFNFDGIFDNLLNILIQLFLQHIELVLGFVFVMLLMSYFQGVLEGGKMRRDRERRNREYQLENSIRSEMRRIDKRLAHERELILKYVQDSEAATRIQFEMQDKNWEQSLKLFKEKDELQLAPLDDDPDVYPNNKSMFVGRSDMPEYYDVFYNDEVAPYDTNSGWSTYWREDGSEEGNNKEKRWDSSLDDTVTIGESSTVIFRDKRRNRFHRGMDDDDEGGGY